MDESDRLFPDERFDEERNSCPAAEETQSPAIQRRPPLPRCYVLPPCIGGCSASVTDLPAALWALGIYLGAVLGATDQALGILQGVLKYSMLGPVLGKAGALQQEPLAGVELQYSAARRQRCSRPLSWSHLCRGPANTVHSLNGSHGALT
ncbi:unnamed protein product [Lota lota]